MGRRDKPRGNWSVSGRGRWWRAHRRNRGKWRPLWGVDPAEWEQERARMRAHQARFRLHNRNVQRTERQLEHLRAEWFALPVDLTG